MVDHKQIKSELKKYFIINGKVRINDHGVVDVAGSVGVKLGVILRGLPVRFGKIDDSFYCEEIQLESLAGAPTWVGGEFWCEYNSLHSLEGAPQFVGRDFRCFWNKLSSLEGGPKHVGGQFYCNGNPLKTLNGLPANPLEELVLDYDSQLPLLKALNAKSIKLFEREQPIPPKVMDIMNKYAGEGKTAMLNCALELKKAGFEGNARW